MIIRRFLKGFGNHNRISIPIAVISLFIYFVFACRLSQQKKVSNLLIYGISFFVFMCVYIISEAVLDYINCEGGRRTNHLFVMSAFAGGVLVYKAYVIETQSVVNFAAAYLRHNVSIGCYFIVLAVVVFILLSLILRVAKTKSEEDICSVELRFGSSILLIFLQGMFLYAPNFFKDSFGGISHIDAYTNSIINALRWVPYSIENTSIYGHYAIFFIIPVKVLKRFGISEWEAVTICIVCVGMLVFCLQDYIVHKIIKNDAIFVMAIIALAVPSFQLYYGIYYQIWPHRLLPPVMVLFGCICSYENLLKGRNKHVFVIDILMWIASAFGIIWSFEVGIVSAIVWTGFWMYRRLLNSTKDIDIFVLGKQAFAAILALVLNVFAAFLCVSVYNIWVGGRLLSFETFIYPLNSKGYNISKLELPLQLPFDGYFFVLALLFGSVSLFIKKMVSLKLTKEELMVVCSALMGCGLYGYYMNRVVITNQPIVCFEVVLITAYYIDAFFRRWNNESNHKSGFMSIIGISGNIPVLLLIIVMSSMCLASVANFGKTLQTKIESEYLKEELYGFVDYLNEMLPDGTAAFGTGTSELFSAMNRITRIYISDWPDILGFVGNESVINPYALDELKRQLNVSKFEYLLVNEKQTGHMVDGYMEADRFSYSGSTYVLYYRGELPYTYNGIKAYLKAIDVRLGTDISIEISEKLMKSFDDGYEEIWKATEVSEVLKEMDDKTFLQFLCSNLLGRDLSEEEIVQINEMNPGGVDRKTFFYDCLRNSEFINGQNQGI